MDTSRFNIAKDTNISLGEHFEDFISHQIESGHYGSASGVVRAGLRLLEDTENKMNTLRQLLAKDEKSGLTDYNYATFIAELDEPDK